MKQIISRFAVAFARSALVVLPVSAAQARGMMCLNCDNGNMFRGKSYTTDWGIYGTQVCVHGDPHSVDELMKRTTYTTYTCNNCGIIQEEQEVETKVVCCRNK